MRRILCLLLSMTVLGAAELLGDPDIVAALAAAQKAEQQAIDTVIAKARAVQMPDTAPMVLSDDPKRSEIERADAVERYLDARKQFLDDGYWQRLAERKGQQSLARWAKDIERRTAEMVELRTKAGVTVAAAMTVEERPVER